MNNLRVLISKTSSALFLALDAERKKKEGSPPLHCCIVSGISYQTTFLKEKNWNVWLQMVNQRQVAPETILRVNRFLPTLP